jgi:hypothetical protein
MVREELEMGVDGIGKGGPLARPMPEVEGRSGATPFQVLREPSATPTAPVTPTASAPATPLERLRAGEIDPEGYLDLKVDGATAHLQGLRPEELDAIKATLREQLASDPALVALAGQATGKRSST